MSAAVLGIFIFLIGLLLSKLKYPIISEEIIELPNGQYAPRVNWRYIWIGVGGKATYSELTNWNTFLTKEHAEQFLEKWKNNRVKGFKTTGLK